MQRIQGFLSQATSATQMVIDLAFSKFLHAHEPELSEMREMQDRRARDWDKIAAPADAELKTHVQAFGYYSDWLNKIRLSGHSIYTAVLKSLHLNRSDAAAITSGSLGLPKFHGVGDVYYHGPEFTGEFNAEDAPKLTHACDTGFFDKDTGRFNKAKFDTLKDYALKKDGMHYISLSQFRQCVKDIQKADHRWDNATYIELGIGCVGNKGEVTSMFDVMKIMGDMGLVGGVSVNNELHFPLPYIEEWYRDTPKVMARIEGAANGLPALPPPNFDKPAASPAVAAPPLTKQQLVQSLQTFAGADTDAVTQEDALGILNFFKQWMCEHPERFKSVTMHQHDGRCYATLFNTSARASMPAAPAPTIAPTPRLGF